MMQTGAASVRFYLKTGSRFEKKSGFLPVKLRLAVSTSRTATPGKEDKLKVKYSTFSEKKQTTKTTFLSQGKSDL